MKELSIVIPVRTGGNAETTLRSLGRSTYQDFDIIVQQDHWGNANKARNAGFAHVTTPYVLFSDDDISWYPDALATMMRVLKANRHASYVYGAYEMAGRIQCNVDFDAERLRRQNYISTMSIIRSGHLNRSARASLPFDPELQRLQDWSLWRSMLTLGFRGIYCGETVFSTQMRLGGITYGGGITYAEAEHIVREKHRNDPRPFNVAIYTLCRDRAEYTAQCFTALHELAGYPFDHYVWDNGSVDETSGLLRAEIDNGNIDWLGSSRVNLGISIGSNRCLDAIFEEGGYSLICKLDNDAKILTPSILASIVDFYKQPGSDRYVTSPRVEGIVNQPRRAQTVEVAGHQVGLTAIVGGLFHCVPANVYGRYTYPEDCFLAHGQDDAFCEWLRQQNIHKGYIEDLAVEHYRGTHQQALDYPQYFRRKWDRDEKMRPGQEIPDAG